MITRERGLNFTKHNASYHLLVKPVLNRLFQAEHEFPAYLQSRLTLPVLPTSAIDPDAAEATQSNIAPINTETPRGEESHVELDYEDHGAYERVLLSAIAWGPQYSAYCVVGDMGSGKTAVIKHVAKALRRPKKALCITCQICEPIILHIDFNEGFEAKQEAALTDEFRERLHDQLRAQLRAQFNSSLRVNDFVAFATRGENLNTFAIFDEFFAAIDKSKSWRSLLNAQHTSLLFEHIAGQTTVRRKLEMLMRLLRFVVLSARPEAACGVLICDNLDKLRSEAQMAVLLTLLANQRYARIKTVVALRRTSFEKLASQRAYSFGVIDHHGPEPITVLRARLEHFIPQFESKAPPPLTIATALCLQTRIKLVLHALDDPEGRIADIVRWLGGDSIRLVLHLVMRMFDNNVLPFDGGPKNPDELAWAVLVDKNSGQLEMRDLLVANVFTDGTRSRLSLLCLRILGILHVYRDRPSLRTIGNLLTILSAVDDWTSRQVLDALNYLLAEHRPLVWVDGRSEFPAGIDVAGPAAREIVFISTIGQNYFLHLVRSLPYVQEAMLGLEWSTADVPTAFDVADLDSRFRTLRACLVQLQQEDARQLKRYREFRDTIFAEAPDITLLSNRIIAGIARAALGIFQATRVRGGLAAAEFREWNSMLITASNLESDMTGKSNSALTDLVTAFANALHHYP